MDDRRQDGGTDPLHSWRTDTDGQTDAAGDVVFEKKKKIERTAVRRRRCAQVSHDVSPVSGLLVVRWSFWKLQVSFGLQGDVKTPETDCMKEG